MATQDSRPPAIVMQRSPKAGIQRRWEEAAVPHWERGVSRPHPSTVGASLVALVGALGMMINAANHWRFPLKASDRPTRTRFAQPKQTLTHPHTCAMISPWQVPAPLRTLRGQTIPWLRRHTLVSFVAPNVTPMALRCRVHVTVARAVPKLKVSKCRRLPRSARCSTPWKPAERPCARPALPCEW